jgi:lysophospholipase L1-like esterase
VYAGVEWAREFWQEEYLRRKKPTVYVPFRIWGVKNWHGKYINNDQGVSGVWRRTISPASCDPLHRVTVWTFGGSTMYGTAVPDWATIPSYLSREMNAAGSRDCVVVSNFGVEGYVTDQESILLAELLKAGGHPDMVIFYDGINDSSLAWPPSGPPDAHFSFRTIKTRVEGSLSGRLDFLQKSYGVRLAREGLARLHSKRSFESLISEAQPNVVATLANYEANMRLVRALSEAYKFRLYCFWQPVLIYGHKPLVPFEEQLATRDASGTSMDSAWFLTIAAVYREAERHAVSNGNFVFLGGLFDSTREPIYVDEAHLGPHGNELAAQAIAAYIQDHPEH